MMLKRSVKHPGYSIAGYGEMQLAKYPFVLYYFEKAPMEP